MVQAGQVIAPTGLAYLLWGFTVFTVVGIALGLEAV